MSVEAYKAVWHSSRMTGNGKLLMLALAEFADDRGRCWPGIERLAEMVGVGRRSIVRLLQQAEALGELVIIRQAGRGNTNSYEIALLKGDPGVLKGDPGGTILTTQKGDPGGRKGDPGGRKGDPGGRKGDPPVTRSVRDPLVEPPEDPPAEEPAAFPFQPAGKSRAPIAPADLRLGAILEVCGLDASVPAHLVDAENAAAQLRAYSADYIRIRYGPGGWWFTADWRGRRGDQPTPRWVVETIAKEQQPAASSNGHGPAPSRAAEALDNAVKDRARLRAELGIIQDHAGAGVDR